MINPDLLQALSQLNRPMVVFLDEEEQEEESELLTEMKRHHKRIEDRPFIVPYPS